MKTKLILNSEKQALPLKHLLPQYQTQRKRKSPLNHYRYILTLDFLPSIVVFISFVHSNKTFQPERRMILELVKMCYPRLWFDWLGSTFEEYYSRSTTSLELSLRIRIHFHMAHWINSWKKISERHLKVKRSMGQE